MPMMHNGPPEWIWERTPDAITWEVHPVQQGDSTVYELSVLAAGGNEIVRLRYFTADEMHALEGLIGQNVP